MLNPNGSVQTAASAYTTTFVVQGGLYLGVQMTKGIQFTQVGTASTATTTSVPFYNASDTVFAGDFADPDSGVADGFSKLAAYGLAGGQYRFLFQSESGAVQSVVSPVQSPGVPVAGNFAGNSGTGDEVGLFTGTSWDLIPVTAGGGQISLGSPTVVPWSTIGGPTGYPVAGDFNGDGFADLAVWSKGSFYVSFADANYATIGSIIPLNFSGTNARPVAADVDGATSGSNDPISDLGLWVPAVSPPSAAVAAEWYFLPSGGTPLEGRTTPITPAQYQFDSSVGVPLAGNFTAATLAGSVTPTVPTSGAPMAAGAAPQLTAGPRMAAAMRAAPAAPTSVTVAGTAGNDAVQLAAGQQPGTWVLTVDGKSQTIGSSVTTLNLNGLAGTNQLSILGTGENETAQVWPTKTIFHSGDLTVTATNFSKTTLNGEGGSDSVVFHDTAAKSSFVAAANDSSLTGANYSAVALNFSKTVAESSAGEKSIANLYESSGAAAITASKSSSIVDLSDLGIGAESAFFSTVKIYNTAGKLLKTLVPTSMSGAPAHRFAPITLSPATSISFEAAAAIAAQNHKKSSGTPAPALIDAVLASYAK